MNASRYLPVQFVAGSASLYVIGQHEHLSQHLIGNAEPRPALRVPGMDMRAGESCVMNIPWGVAP